MLTERKSALITDGPPQLRIGLVVPESYPRISLTPWRYLLEGHNCEIQRINLPTEGSVSSLAKPVREALLTNLVVGHAELLDILPYLDEYPRRPPAFVIPDVNHHSPHLLRRLGRASNAWRDCDVAFCGGTDASERFRAILGRADPYYPLGIPTEVFSPLPGRTAIKARYGLSDRNVIYAGRFAPDKNVIQLADAYSNAASSRHDDVGLVLCSRTFNDRLLGDFLRRIPELIRRRVRIFENPSPSLLAELYSASDIYLSLAHSEHETFGRSVVESMACGCVPVVWRYSGHKDTVPKEGFLVPKRAQPEVDVADMMAMTEHLATALSICDLSDRSGALVAAGSAHDSRRTMKRFLEVARHSIYSSRGRTRIRSTRLPHYIARLAFEDGVDHLSSSLSDAASARAWWFEHYY